MNTNVRVLAKAKNHAEKWFNLLDYATYNLFIQAVTQFAESEGGCKVSDVDFVSIEYPMCVGRELIEGNTISAELWHLLNADENDLEVLEAYYKCFGKSGKDYEITIQHAKDALMGQYENDANFAYEQADLRNELENVPDHIVQSIDWENAGRLLMENNYESADNYYFQADTTY